MTGSSLGCGFQRRGRFVAEIEAAAAGKGSLKPGTCWRATKSFCWIVAATPC